MERDAVTLARRSPPVPEYNTSTSTLAFDQHLTTTPKGILLMAEIVCGMLVWILVGGTEYFHLSALCWVMFVSILCWVLTICLFIIYLTGAHNRIQQVPWTTLVTHTHTPHTHILTRTHSSSVFTICVFFVSCSHCV
ncbi:hypothetical protein PAMA_014861 [Pampus argenteus]